MTQAYPLQWPKGRPRTSSVSRKRARFSKGTTVYDNDRSWTRQTELSVADAVKRLQIEADRIGAFGLVISTNLELRNDGLPRSGQRAPNDPGVCVYFELEGKSRAMPCDTYDKVEGNIAAIAAHIEATRQIERHGVASVSEMFAGFAALPAPESQKPRRPWWEVLGLAKGTADPDVVNAAYRAKAKRAHPDAGGSAEAMAELNQAREDALS